MPGENPGIQQIIRKQFLGNFVSQAYQAQGDKEHTEQDNHDCWIHCALPMNVQPVSMINPNKKRISTIPGCPTRRNSGLPYLLLGIIRRSVYLNSTSLKVGYDLLYESEGTWIIFQKRTADRIIRTLGERRC